jgi:hypothetical protein
MKGKYKSVIFLDFDGVFNCQSFYDDPLEFHPKNITDDPYSHNLWNCSKKRIDWFNQLCKDTGAVVVISASLKNSWDVEGLRDLFARMGGTFEIVGKTNNCKCRIRGVEIYEWLKDNSIQYFGTPYYDFHKYAIIDDDSDMLLCQWENFFHVDNYTGLTPIVCYKVKRFLTGKTF